MGILFRILPRYHLLVVKQDFINGIVIHMRPHVLAGVTPQDNFLFQGCIKYLAQA